MVVVEGWELEPCLLSVLLLTAGRGAVKDPSPPLVPGSGASFSWAQPGPRAARADCGPPQAMRTLSWKHTLGLVTMDVELADRTLSVAVTPVQAVVLLYFQDQGEPIGPLPACPCLASQGAGARRCSMQWRGGGGRTRPPEAPWVPLPSGMMNWAD